MATINVLNTSSNLSGKTLLTAENAYTVTGGWTFDRDPNPPFAVSSGSGEVANLKISASNLSSGIVPVSVLGAGVSTFVSNTQTGTQNDWTISGLSGDSLVAWNGASNIVVTGINNTITGQRLTFYNSSASNFMTFNHQDAGSIAGNRLNNPLTLAIVIGPRGTITYQSFGAGSGWAPLSIYQTDVTQYTPTFTGFTIGNGSVNGEYYFHGDMVWWRAAFTFGSTSAVGASLVVSVPVTGANSFNMAAGTHGIAQDVSAGPASYIVSAVQSSTSAVFLTSSASPVAALATTVPFTWATGDLLSVQGVYSAA